MKIRYLMTATAWMVGAVACSTPPMEEKQATSEQRLTEGSGADAACVHPICAAGAALAPSCDPCATLVCAQDPYCCGSAWDETCVGEVASICGQSCAAPPPVDAGSSTCAHPVCATGSALSSTCDACATALCAQDPYCCAVTWDATCVGEVASICKQSCN